MREETIILSDRSATLKIEETPETVIVHFEVTKIGDFATVQDIASFGQFFLDNVDRYKNDGRHMITMYEGQVMGVVDDDGNADYGPFSKAIIH